MQLALGSVFVLVSLSSLALNARGQGMGAWEVAETGRLQSNLAPEDYGRSIDLDGGTLVVGSGGDGIFVYDQVPGSPGAWTQVGVLDAGAVGFFGVAPPLVIDGDRVAVGHNPAGSPAVVRVFERDAGGPGAWGQVAELAPPASWQTPSFGAALGLSGDTIIVGDPGSNGGDGAAFVFERDELGGWHRTVQLNPTPPTGSLSYDFGKSVALEGGSALVGARGTVHSFLRNWGGNETWGESQVIRPTGASAQFGWGVAISGQYALIGDPNYQFSGPGAGLVYRFPGWMAGWVHIQTLESPDPIGSFGAKVALSGSLAAVGQIGEMRLFEVMPVDPGLVTESVEVLPATVTPGFFGSAVALDADTLVVGVDGNGAGASLGAFAALGYEGSTGRLLGAAGTPSQLIEVDSETGLGTPIGPFGLNQISGMAYDPDSDTLFGVDSDADALVMIDSTTGAATPIGPIGINRIFALTYDRAAGELFGIRRVFTSSVQLVTIDPSSGAGVTLGGIVSGDVRGLALDPSSGALFGARWDTDKLVSIDRLTGALTPIGPLGFDQVEGMTFDDAGELWATDRSTDLLLNIDCLTGLGAVVGLLSGPVGAAHVFQVSYPSTVYCTAGTSGNGCQALLSATGSASTSAAAGFVLTGSGVTAGLPGQFYYGSNGVQASLWGSGTSFQCVTPPLVRAGLLQSSSGAACAAGFQQDLNALWSANPDKRPEPGFAHAQLWYRDPLSTSNQTTSLSDALEFYVWP